MLQRLPFFEDEKRRILEAVADLLHDSYGSDEKYIEALQPDLLGEYLIGRVITKHGEEFFERILL